jgi:hypothetical protein
LLKIVEFWRQTSVDAEDFIVDNGCDWEAIEALDKLLPEFKTVSSLAFVIKSIDSVN